MKKIITEEEVTYEPVYEITKGRGSRQLSKAMCGDTILWWETTIFPHNPFKSEIVLYSFDYSDAKSVVERLVEPYGGRIEECPYEEDVNGNPLYYPVLLSFDMALKFYNEKFQNLLIKN